MIEPLPVAASADGQRNAFIHSCDVLKQRRHYAVCLHLCDERKKGRLDIVYSDCSSLIGKKTCPALKMRKEEMDAGHAIYFEERRKIVPGFFDTAKNLVGEVKSFVGRSVKSLPNKPKPVDLLSSIDTGTYADAINSAIQAPKVETPKVEASKEIPRVAPVAGESLLDMARRLMGK